MALPRRKIDEIIVRYKLEPTLDDVYVEGSFDKRILDKAFKELSIVRPVYEIDTVDISDEMIAKYGLTRGNKQEVLALCYELSLPDTFAVTFFVDRDGDEYLGRMSETSGVVYSTHCDLEGAFFSSDIVHELVCDAGGVKCDAWPEMYSSIEQAVKSIFALRLALHESGFTVPNIQRSLSKSGAGIAIDVANLLQRCALPSDEGKTIMNEAQAWKDKFDHLEARKFGRGHDYLQILEWVIKKWNGNRGVAGTLDRLLILLVPRAIMEITAPFSSPGAPRLDPSVPARIGIRRHSAVPRADRL